MEIQDRIVELSALRAHWKVPRAASHLALRRAHAAWCNAGIEGNPLPWNQARDLLLNPGSSSHVSERGRVELEPIGCLRALDFLDGWEGGLALGLVRHLHGILMEGLSREPGRLRQSEVRIIRASGKAGGRDAGETVFRPPHWGQVPDLLEQLLASLAQAEDPFLQSGRFHYEFQSIHPFEDGNGRLGRLLSDFLARRGWDSRGFHLAPAIARSGPVYYRALRSVRPDYGSEIKENLKSWLLPFFDILEDALLHPDPPVEPADA